MERIERTPVEDRGPCDLEEGMDNTLDTLLLVLAWVVIMGACVWLLHEIVHAAQRYPEWKGLLK